MIGSIRDLILVQSDSDQLNEQIQKPIGASKRIRYTCASACDGKLVCGTSTGSLYLFRFASSDEASCPIKNEIQFERKIVYSQGQVTAISFSRKFDSHYLAFGTSNGSLILLQQTPSDGVAWRELTVCSKFAGQSIAHLTLSANEAGDVKVYFAGADHSVYIFERLQSVSQLLFRPSLPIRLLKLDCPVHQFHVWQSRLLLVVTDQRSLLLNLIDMSLAQLGSRSRPAGCYGACFVASNVDSEIDVGTCECIFSSRPGLRLWQVNLNGQVLVTHQFKNSVITNDSCLAVLQKPNYTLKQNSLLEASKTWSTAFFQSLHVLCFAGSQFLITYTNVPLPVLFLIDPFRPEIIFCNHFDDPISSLIVFDNQIIVIQSIDAKLRFLHYTVESLSDALQSKWMYFNRHTWAGLLVQNLKISSDFLKQNRQIKQTVQQICSEENMTSLESKTLRSLLMMDFELNNDSESSEQSSCELDVNSNQVDLIIEKVKHLYSESNGHCKSDTNSNNYQDSSQDSNCSSTVTHFIQNRKCNCGNPVPASHLNLPIDLLQIQRKLLQTMNFDEHDLDKCSKQCFQHSLWELYSQVLLLQRNYDAFLRTAFMLNDLSLLENLFFRTVMVHDSNLQNQIFTLYFQQLADNDCIRCLECGHLHLSAPISWFELIEYVYVHTSANRLLELLLLHQDLVQKMKLPLDFIQKLIKKEMLKRYESSLANFKVQSLQRQLTKSKLYEQMRPITNNRNVCQKFNLNEKECSSCNQKLSNTFDLIVRFKCGHLYHKRCESNQTCNLCGS